MGGYATRIYDTTNFEVWLRVNCSDIHKYYRFEVKDKRDEQREIEPRNVNVFNKEDDMYTAFDEFEKEFEKEHQLTRYYHEATKEEQTAAEMYGDLKKLQRENKLLNKKIERQQKALDAIKEVLQ